jgi:hypothetical protein
MLRKYARKRLPKPSPLPCCSGKSTSDDAGAKAEVRNIEQPGFFPVGLCAACPIRLEDSGRSREQAIVRD